MNAVHFNDADLNLIKVLDALVREVSVARAARRLGVTPSAISHALGRLRLMLRDPVVVRSGAKPAPDTTGSGTRSGGCLDVRGGPWTSH